MTDQFRVILSSFSVFVLLAVLVPNGVSARMLPAPDRKLKPVDDPRVLPYRFQEEYVRPIPSFYDGLDWAFLEPERRESDGVFEIQQNWREGEQQTAVVYSSFLTRYDTRHHENVESADLESWRVYDSDGGGNPAVVATYIRQDTVWLWLHDVARNSTREYPVIVGEDRDGSGYWDGRVLIGAVEDFDQDGVPDFLLGVDTGYDLVPRAVLLINGASGTVEWQYELANSSDPSVVVPGRNGRRIVVGTGSKGNDLQVDGMDDSHSYLIVLDSLGQRLWVRETSGQFGSAQAAAFDVGGDGSVDILTSARYEVYPTSKDTVYGGCLLALDVDGKVLDSLDFGLGQIVRRPYVVDVDNDGISEVVVPTYGGEAESWLHILDDRLRVVRGVQLPATHALHAWGDFVGDGSTQMVLCGEDGRRLLLDKDLNLLAQTDQGYSPHHLGTGTWYRPRAAPEQKRLIMKSVDLSRQASVKVVANPWFSIFFRKPWLTAAAGGAPVLVITAMIAFYTVSVRRKNRLIADTNSQLESALVQLQEAQARLVEAEKYKQAKDIAGGFAHEIRNALMPIEGVLQRVQHHSRDSQKAQKIARYCQMGNESLDDALTLTEQIGKYAKLEATRAEEPVELMGVISKVVAANRVACENAGVRVLVEGPEVAPVVSNGQQMQIVLTNLVRNSLDALTKQGGGRILIEVRREDSSTILTVADNGPGIPAEDAERVFEMFYSTKPDTGTGIGLAMVKKIIELYGGEIRLDAAEGPGAKFFIRLKRA